MQYKNVGNLGNICGGKTYSYGVSQYWFENVLPLFVHEILGK